ncbi:hypothetical protein AOB60_24320 [Streptomyces noursei]|uniref:Uncharacterized protein n=1 Tax=Streptomyces noursei TaxID=1971 RepID=A0A2N8P8T8_STRNR|nr:hypothetical protein AOB60_24320 [Streptomyces noursei]
MGDIFGCFGKWFLNGFPCSFDDLSVKWTTYCALTVVGFAEVATGEGSFRDEIKDHLIYVRAGDFDQVECHAV